jgi:4-carboxymuconolactone decarboxylase
MTDHLPDIYQSFRADFPAVAQARDQFGKSVADAGPLDERTRWLVKVGIAVGAVSDGAVRSAARKALAAGATEVELEQVALLAISARGFPSAIAALGWLREVFPPRP